MQPMSELAKRLDRDGPPGNKGKTFPAEILTPEEMKALLSCLDPDTWMGARNRALITVLYRAGLRHSEALHLLPHHVDTETGIIQVLHGKGDRRRSVGLDPGAGDVVDHWKRIRITVPITADAPLFCTRYGKHISLSYLRTVLPKLARKVGITKRVHPHGFRHTHAYELMMEGVEMPIIQRQLGHMSLATTDTYLSHIAPRQVIEAITKREWSL